MAENSKNKTSDVHAYRNKNTGDVYAFDGPSADLEARSNFERVKVSEVPAATLQALDVARAKRASIEHSAHLNAQRVEVSGREAARAAGAAAEPTGSTGTPVSAAGTGVASTSKPTNDGILSRPGMRAVQIGPNPEQHPSTRAELEAQAAKDAEQPAAPGVLSRDDETLVADTKQAAAEIADATGEDVATGDGETVSGDQGDGETPAKATRARRSTSSK